MASRAAAAPAPEVEETVVEETPVKEPTTAQKRRAAYSAAETRLRERYPDEFKALVNEEAAARGVTYVFRLTEEERAAQQLRELLAKYPGLGEQVTTPQPLPAQ